MILPFRDDGHDPIRVLYVDDDAALGLLVRKALERRGYAVTNALSGKEGLALLVDQSFDVIALDHEMPGETGLGVLAELAALPVRPPVVYVTGMSDARIAVEALKSGADDYVIKSVSSEFYDLLHAALHQAVERWRLRRAREDSERAIREARDRAEVLLKEVNHRIANSLGLVAAMVRMQAAMLRDPAAVEALKETQARISAIGGVHRRLYSSGHVGLVEMDDYLANLLGEIEMSLKDAKRPYSVRFSSDPVRLSTDKAVSLGVMISELVTNAFKYAYGEGVPAEIRVGLRFGGEGRVIAVVEDDGSGYSPTAVATGTGIGSKIIDAMAANLQASVTRDEAHRGTRVVIELATD